MNKLINTNQNLTMSSQEIADLVKSRHDNVKTSMERLAEKGLIQLPALQELGYINNLGLNCTIRVYNISKRDSYVVVAQLSPEFTAALVDRWQELENNQPKPRALTMREMILYTLALEDEKERLQIELDQSKQWLTIKKVAAHNHINWKSLEWRKLKETSIVIGLLPKKIFDSNFPDGVNCYSKDAWRIVYPNLILPNGEI